MNRRRFLRGAGGALLALPLFARPARSSDQFPLRFVCIYTGNGFRPDQFLPIGSEDRFSMGGMLGPLSRHQSKLIVAHGSSGLDGHYAGHTELLTGRPNPGASFMPTGGPSLDQLLAASNKGKTPLLSLELGVEPWSGSDGAIAFSASGLPIPPIADPRGGFDRVYNLASVDPAVAAARRSRKISVIDSVMEDFSSIQNELSPSERRILDEHLTLLREEEQSLLHPVEVANCDLGPAPTGSTFTFPETFDHHLSTITAALRCDITRIATLVVKGSQDTTYYTWAGATDDAHSVAHGVPTNAAQQLLAINTWQAEQVASFLDRLDAVPEGDGTLLDHTLVLWTNEIGLQNWSHSRASMGLVMAGATNVLRTGRFVDLSGYLYQDVLLTLARAMGQEVDSFGDDGAQVVETLLA